MNAQWQELQQKVATAMLPARQWYQSREPREQQVLKLLAAVVALLLFWAVIWQPAWSVRAQQIQQWESQAQLLQWMQANENQIRTAQRSGNKTTAQQGDWISSLTRSAATTGITLKGFTPEGDDGVRIQLENQPFAAAFGWLQLLSTQGVQVASAEFLPGAGAGRVNVRATLRRSF